MKKLYENPLIAVSEFDAENIITASGDGAEQAAAYLTSNGYTADKIDLSTLNFTF